MPRLYFLVIGLLVLCLLPALSIAAPLVARIAGCVKLLYKLDKAEYPTVVKAAPAIIGVKKGLSLFV